MKDKIWLSSPHMGGREQHYVQEAFDTNWVAPLGPNVNGFEKDLETYLGQQAKVACLASGTSALHLALILAGVTHGDEVLCQSMTFSASANPIVYQGATPVFVDSEPQTWNICPSTLEEAITARIKAKGTPPKALIVVHLYGMPAQMDPIAALAKKYNITLIEDAAEALGSTYNGQQCGTFGDYGILSFNGNKIITTSGGGALVCRNEADKQKAIFLATQARDQAPHYQHSEIGYNYRMSNIVAGIGRGQMEVLDKHIALRQANNQFYQTLFKPIEGVRVFAAPAPSYVSNHWLSAIIMNDMGHGKTAEGLRLALEVENIESRPLWKPMHLQPVFKTAPYYGENRVAETLFEKGVCLPSGSNLTDTDRERIAQVVQTYFYR
ncbi:pyridoxal phosphate-dependent aminotransferase [Mangrovimonas yunxiaonensis]|uniref:GDP-perosamine synthase n=1 Tax=Mangrovimonas yunxiaonensis TaxID=1197477 RepID=A0A084TI15_9FLAO|nr:aminotransferase class I/II-fold pyridoxal phosphate-dependent enzyme [Mangrovimonas yunxiaonensis]KFB00351.1 pyridoxal phosphate-dependent aminotransferase [Mangrovimonas yunxiaonensis]GGH35288.1 pyridoxal phosphate-dependent aminotransferase [Mangrovimonas yunxiaonensis]